MQQTGPELISSNLEIENKLASVSNVVGTDAEGARDLDNLAEIQHGG